MQTVAIAPSTYTPTRPVSYAWLIDRVNDALKPLKAARLWVEVFNEPPPNVALEVAEKVFLERVSKDLFPLDEMRVEELIYNGDPMAEAIPISGYRIAFEAAAVADLEPYQQAAGAVMTLNYLQEQDEWFFEDIGFPPDVWWLAPYASAEAWRIGLNWLTAQGDLWAGLGQMIYISMQQFANPFLLLPGPDFVDDYQYTFWYWTLADVRLLAAYWQEAQPVVTQIEAFKSWFEAAPAQNHYAVMEMLAKCSEATWKFDDPR